jgi:hypothetical protein
LGKLSMPCLKEKIPMIRTLFCLLGATLACGALHAQTTSPLIAEAKASYTSVKTNLIKAAEKMPEDAYSFRITPDNQTWAERVAHVATSAMGSCARVKGEQKQANLGSNSKADLSAALKAAFDECDAAWDSVTDANMSEMVGAGRGQATRLGSMIRNTVHITEVYGTMTAYLRLKGIVPPSSEGSRGGR